MIILKLLINFLPALAIIASIYFLFYFDVIPSLLRHYRKATEREKTYTSEIRDIEKDDWHEPYV